MSTTYLESAKDSFGKAPIKMVELSTSIQIDPALTDMNRTKRSKLEHVFKGVETLERAHKQLEQSRRLL